MFWRSWLCAVPLLSGALVLCGGLTDAAFAEPLRGRVQDRQTGAALGGAWVQVREAGLETLSEPDGTFVLDGGVVGQRVTVAARNYFTAGKDWPAGGGAVDFALDRVPHDPSLPVDLIEPSACQGCHAAQVEEWKQSGMAHAGKNTWVEDLYSGTATPRGMEGFVYTRDSVHRTANPASECAACHQPETWFDAPFTPYLPQSAGHAASERGVSCITCHMIRDVDESKPSFPGIFPGVVTMNRGSIVRFGMLGDVDYHAQGRMRAAYQPQLGSAVCGTCHQDSGDPKDNHSFDGPISEPTYLEWLASPYADPGSPHFQNCTDCHSRATDAPSASSLQEGPTRPPGQVRSHDFPGTTPDFLEKAITLEVEPIFESEVVHVSVTLTNTGAGHHVPTGVTIRNMILLVEAYDADGVLQELSGQRVGAFGGEGDPKDGYFASLPGKLYAKINRDAAGKQGVLFTEAVAIDHDNRIPPLGVDRTTFTFARGDRPLATLSVRLIYRRAWRRLVDAKGWDADGRGRPLGDLAAPHFGHLMEAVRVGLDFVDGTVEPVEPPPDVVEPPPSVAELEAGLPGGCRGAGGTAWVSGLGGVIVVLSMRRSRSRRLDEAG